LRRSRAEALVERLLSAHASTIEDNLPAGMTVERVEDLRQKISGAVWDTLYIIRGPGGRYVIFSRRDGQHTGLLKVPPNVFL
jgi:hypothetical protein